MTTIIIIVVVALVFFVTVCVVTFMVWKREAEMRTDSIREIKDNLQRLEEDVSWLIDKFDYRNKDADWKTSKDALQRGMQKLRGGYPADPPFKQK